MAYQPSPTHAWRRIARHIAVYSGEFNKEFYQELLQQHQCPVAIATIQKAGVVFTRDICRHYCFEICGTFEVTGRYYLVPKGCNLPAASVLYNTMCRLFGYEETE